MTITAIPRSRRLIGAFSAFLFIAVLALMSTQALGAGLSLTSTLVDGQRVAGSVQWRVTAANGTPTRVEFSIDGTYRWTEWFAPYDFNGDNSTLDTTTLADGPHVLRAVAYDGNAVAADNSATVTVDNTPNVAATTSAQVGSDLALGKVASASSVEPPDQYNGFGVFAAANAVDGDSATRWSSAYADNQWWQVDLGSAQQVSSVSVVWEAAFASSYKIQVSTDGVSFTDAASVSNNAAGVKTTVFAPVSARYVRILGLTRATPYGFSFFTAQVFGPGGGGSSGAGLPATAAQSGVVTASGGGGSDLALGKVASASSVEPPDQYNGFGVFAAANAVDGDSATRWSSAYADNQWWQVDLGAPRSVTSVAVDWEAAYAKTYLVQASADGSNFTTVASEAMSGPANRTSTFSPVNARYIRVHGLTRGTQYGFSAWTIRVLGGNSPTAGALTPPSAPADPVTPAVTPAPAGPPASTGSPGSRLPDRLGSSSGGSLFVSGSQGSDANPGTIDRPFATIGKAWSVASAGTTINVRAGSYGGQINLQGTTASATNPITVRAYPGERVLLTGPAMEGYPAVYITSSTGVRLQGFEIANAKGDGVKVDSAADVEVVGNDIHDNGMQGIIVGGEGDSGRTYSSNVQIWNNRIHANGGWWPNGDPYALIGTHGVYYGNTSSNTDGIRHGTDGGVIANNLFYDQRFGYHVQVGSQNDGLIITNNTFDNASQSDTRAGNAVQIYGEDNAFATKNVLVVNNIIANDANRGVYGSGGSMTSNVVRNNLTYNNPLGDIVPQYGSAILFTVGPGNVNADPQFADRSSKTYQLRASSPAVGTADSGYAPPLDFYGRARVGSPDLGAVENQG